MENGSGGGLFRLDLGAREPFWLEIMPGVELLVQPFDSRAQYAATFESLAARTDIKEMVERVQRGEDPADAAELATAAAFAAGERGAQTFDFVLALAKRVVLDWRGVGSWDSDEPLPFTMCHLEVLFRQAPQAAQGFNLRYGEHGAALAREKKVSANGPDGIVGGAPATAADAGSEASPAPTAGSAPPDSAPT